MKKRMIVVGGVAGGASAAARARRLSEDAEIIVVERGEYVSFANCGLPYFIGGEIAERNDLMVRTPADLRRQFNLDVRVMTEAVGINTAAKTVTLRDLQTAEETVERYDALVLSPGAAPIRPAIPGADLPEVYTLRSVPDMDAIVRACHSATKRRAVVIGAGLIGLEMAENLLRRGFRVHQVERLGQVLPLLDPEMSYSVQREMVARGIDLHLSDSAACIEKRMDSGIDVTLKSGATLEADFAILSVGVRPDVSLARGAGIQIGKRGGIKVDKHMRTSAPDVYAVGDAVEIVDRITGEEMPVPLAGPANRQGRVAANTIFGLADSFDNTQGTWIVRVFALTAAGTGASEHTLRAKEMRYEKVYLHPFSHASYFPGFSRMSMKLLFSPESGRVLGCQIVGTDGVDKRVDVISTAIRGGMTVSDLETLELAYAPPYGSAKDPVNMAGYIAANVLRGKVAQIHWDELAKGLDPAKHFMLDVRDAGEVEAQPYPDATNIPLPSLRQRLGEIPRDREIIIACTAGLRGYLAARILSLQGFSSVRNLSGGYLTLWAGMRK